MSPNLLSRTLAIKERLRQWRRAELHEANTEVARAQDEVDEQTARHQRATAAVTTPGEISATDLALRAEQVAREQAALRRAQKELAARENERERRSEVAGEASREVRAIEVLHERLVTERKREEGLREQRDLDEASARKGGKRP
jgi:flagellar export protein FliJ